MLLLNLTFIFCYSLLKLISIHTQDRSIARQLTVKIPACNITPPTIEHKIILKNRVPCVLKRHKFMNMFRSSSLMRL